MFQEEIGHMRATVRRGKPLKRPKEGERISLGLRVRAETKRRLVKAAEREGRSFSQEAEARLEASLQKEDFWGGPKTAAAMKMLAGAVELVEGMTDKSWGADYKTYIAARKAINLVLDSLQPKPGDNLAWVRNFPKATDPPKPPPPMPKPNYGT